MAQNDEDHKTFSRNTKIIFLDIDQFDRKCINAPGIKFFYDQVFRMTKISNTNSRVLQYWLSITSHEDDYFQNYCIAGN